MIFLVNLMIYLNRYYWEENKGDNKCFRKRETREFRRKNIFNTNERYVKYEIQKKFFFLDMFYCIVLRLRQENIMEIILVRIFQSYRKNLQDP